MKNVGDRVRLSVLLLAGASWSNAALAQTPAAPEAASEDIVVTGTAIRGVAPTGAATVNIGRTALIENSGVRDPSAVIAALPQASGQGNTLGNNAGRNAGVNLRGLGTNATLLLFDGHRSVAQGVTNQIADPNTIPFGAIERVEVVTDGASAIYGSDAVAGVVNYILRRPYDGAEISTRYTNSLYQQYGADVSGGKTWDSGGVMMALGYEKNGHVKRGVIPLLASDLRPFGGNDGRINGTTVTPGRAGAVVVSGQVYAIPNGLNGRTPTAAEMVNLTNNQAAINASLVDTAQYSDYYTARERISGVFRANQDWGLIGETTFTVLFNNRKNNAPGTGDGAFTNIGVTVAPTSPYYIAGLGTGNQTITYNFRANNPSRPLDQNNTENTFNIYVDHKVDIGKDFQLSLGGVYGNEFGCAVCQPQGNTVLTAVITQPSTASQFNPYIQGPQAGAEGIFGGFIQKASNQLADFVAKLDGPVFPTPGGEARIAIGAEYQKLDYKLVAMNTLNLTTTYQISRYAKSHRIIKSGFAELLLPLFGAQNALPLMQRLDVDLAVRYDDYNDVGSTTNPKFGVTWEPTDSLTFQGSFGTSFRAPTLGESDPRTVGQTNRVLVANNLNNPLIPRTTATSTLILSRGGNSGNLGPETAKTYSFGAQFAPSFIEGLKLGVNYYNVNYRDRIQNTPNATTFLSNQTLFDQVKDFFIIAPQPASCVNGAQPGQPGNANYATYNAEYLRWLNDPNAVYSPTTENDCSLKGIFVGGSRNLGKVEQTGVDLTASYVFETPIGRASLGGSFSKVLKLKTALLPNAIPFSALDTIGNQNSERGRFNAALRHGPFNGTVAVNYVGSYLNNAPISVSGVTLPNTTIPSWTTVDAGLAWQSEQDNGPLSGVRAAVNVQNVADKDPPIVLSGTNAVDLNNHNIFGRVWQFELTKAF